MDVHSSQHSWDLHFMKEAKLWMSRGKCLSRQIGAVLVQGKNVIATGYNGPPSGIPHCDFRDDRGQYTDTFVSDVCPRKRMGFGSGYGMEHCPAVHAEINPIMQAARLGVSTVGSTLYAYCKIPCSNCMKEIVQAGVKRIVCLGHQEDSVKVGYNFPLSEQLYKLAGIQLDVITEEEVNNG